MEFDSHLVPVIIVVFLMLAVIVVFFVYNPVHEGFEPYSDAGLSNFLATNPDALALIQIQRDGVAQGCATVSNFAVVPGAASNTPQCKAVGAAFENMVKQRGGPMAQALQAKFGNVPPNFAAATAIAVAAPVWPPPGVVAAPPPVYTPATQQAISEFLVSNPDAAELIRLQKDEVQNGCASFATGTRQPGPNIGSPQCPPKVFATNAALQQRQPAFANAFFAKFGPPTTQLIQDLVKATATAVTAPAVAEPMAAAPPSVMPVPPTTPGAPMGMSAAPTVGTQGTKTSIPLPTPAAPISVVPESLKPETILSPATPLMGTPAPFTANSSHAPATLVIPEDTPPGTYLLRAVT